MGRVFLTIPRRPHSGNLGGLLKTGRGSSGGANGESEHLPLILAGFDSRAIQRVDFVVGSPLKSNSS